LGPLGAIAVEGRYQSLGGRSDRGLSIGLRLGARVLKRSSPNGGRRNDGVAASIVDFALGAMGTPYQWGGTGGNGFDCSGLIQFAYAKAGVSVPRRSVDQAAFGREVGQAGSELRPGDILVFSANPGGGASHVGLYVGDGRFIHSASQGVQISELSATDPTGQWWLQRWISTRRVIE
jgi:cell wall-associated NlpC family hydrolase